MCSTGPNGRIGAHFTASPHAPFSVTTQPLRLAFWAELVKDQVWKLEEPEPRPLDVQVAGVVTIPVKVWQPLCQVAQRAFAVRLAVAVAQVVSLDVQVAQVVVQVAQVVVQERHGVRGRDGRGIR